MNTCKHTWVDDDGCPEECNGSVYRYGYCNLHLPFHAKALTARVVVLETALGKVIPECDRLHHDKDDQHSSIVACPVERQIADALEKP